MFAFFSVHISVKLFLIQKTIKSDRISLHTKTCCWLNIAEIEINVMDTKCTGRRIVIKQR